MIEVTEELTRRIARLSRLSLTENEVKEFTPQLGQILKYMETLEEVPVDGTELMTHPHSTKPTLREDHAEVSPRGEDQDPKVMDCGPEVIDHAYKVPLVK